MGAYDTLIGIPVSGQKISVGTYGIPVRNAILDLDRRLALREAAETLPAKVSVMGNGANTLAGGANVYTALPTFPAAVSITNPSTEFSLVCNVLFGCWMLASAGDVRMGIALSGGLTVAANTLGANQPVGHGMYPFATSTTSEQHMGFFQMTIPPGAAAVTLTAHGARSNGTANAQVNYASIDVVPARFTV